MPNMEQKDWSGFAEGGADKNGWRTIESAPRDKRRVMVFVPRFGPFTGHFDEEWHIAGLWTAAEPTHWQPLPAPPEPSEVNTLPTKPC